MPRIASSLISSLLFLVLVIKGSLGGADEIPHAASPEPQSEAGSGPVPGEKHGNDLGPHPSRAVLTFVFFCLRHFLWLTVSTSNCFLFSFSYFFIIRRIILFIYDNSFDVFSVPQQQQQQQDQ